MDAGSAEIDLEAREVRFGGRTVPFELDDDTRHRLLNGLDDIALTLAQVDAIDAYERDRERAGPVTIRRDQTLTPYASVNASCAYASDAWAKPLSPQLVPQLLRTMKRSGV